MVGNKYYVSGYLYPKTVGVVMEMLSNHLQQEWRVVKGPLPIK